MIIVNGGGNPDSVTFGGTSLDNVYFNGTLVWNRTGRESAAGQTDQEVPASESGSSTGSSAAAASQQQAEASGAPAGYAQQNGTTSGTARVTRGDGSVDAFNDGLFMSYVTYIDSSGQTTGWGAVYEGLLSCTFSWDRYKVLSTEYQTSKVYVLGNNRAVTGTSGMPSGMQFWAFRVSNAVQITLGVITQNTHGVFDPSLIVNRVYNAKLVDGGFVVQPAGDEYILCTVTTGFVFQGAAMMYLESTQ